MTDSPLTSDPPTTAITGDVNAHLPTWDHECYNADDVGRCVDACFDAGDWTVLNGDAPTHENCRGNTSFPDVTACSRGLAMKCVWSVGEDWAVIISRGYARRRSSEADQED